MSDRLEYGFESNNLQRRLYADIPQSVVEKMVGEDNEISEIIGNLTSDNIRAVEITEDAGNLRMYLNAKRIGSLKMGPVHHVVMQGIAKITNALYYSAEPEEGDARLNVRMGVSPINNTNRYGMYANIAWASEPDETLSRLATHHMRSTAKNLDYEDKNMIPSLVYAQVSRAQGVTLETNPMGSCSIGTDGMWYESGDPRYELFSHNIYNHVQQFICLAGAVALAHADKLVKD